MAIKGVADNAGPLWVASTQLKQKYTRQSETVDNYQVSHSINKYIELCLLCEISSVFCCELFLCTMVVLFNINYKRERALLLYELHTQI